MSKSAIIFIYTCFTTVLLAQAERSVQGAFGAVTIDGKIWNQIALRPIIPIWKFGVALDLVFYIDADGNIQTCRTDYSITLWDTPTLAGEALEELIMRSAPTQWFELLGKVADPNVDTSLSGITLNTVVTKGEPTPAGPAA